jgi:hypothetical protein
MKCPVCPDSTLLMSERKGVEIDYCPACRGVWLDRGELDKLIELSLTPLTPAAPQPPPPQAPMPPPPERALRRDDDDRRSDRHEHERYERERHYKDSDRDRDYKDDRGHYHRRRKESWLSDLFD